MKCPKCGYIGFDFYDTCPKCNRDLTEVRNKLIFFPFKVSPVNWLETKEEESLSPRLETATGEVTPEERVAGGEEIELETVSLDSLDIGGEKEESLHEQEEKEEIEIEPVDLKLLEEQMKRREKKKEKEQIKEEKKEKEIELEPIDLESLEIEFEENKDKEQ